MNIIFMGTAEFAKPALQLLVEYCAMNKKCDVKAVYTASPKKSGRGQRVKKNIIHQFAESADLPIFCPRTLKTEEELNIIKQLKPDLIIVVAYGLLLPQKLLEIPKYGCFNIHPSALPRWRGAAPIERSLMAGDEETSVCIMKMDSGLDTGDIILQQKIKQPIWADAGYMHRILSNIGAEILIETIEKLNFYVANRESSIIANKVPNKLKGQKKLANILPFGDNFATAQSNAGITYADKLKESDFTLDFSKPVRLVYNKIRGLAPFYGAQFFYEGKRFKILKANFIEQENSNKNAQLGIVINKSLEITCKNGIIAPIVIKPEGKRAMDVKDFLNGANIKPGSVLQV